MESTEGDETGRQGGGGLGSLVVGELLPECDGELVDGEL